MVIFYLARNPWPIPMNLEPQTTVLFHVTLQVGMFTRPSRCVNIKGIFHLIMVRGKWRKTISTEDLAIGKLCNHQHF